MSRHRPAYPPEFRRRRVDPARSGRTPEGLSREFEPSAAAIAGRVRRTDAEGGTRLGVVTAAEREELSRLRRENPRLHQEGNTSAKAPAWFAAKDAPSGRTG